MVKNPPANAGNTGLVESELGEQKREAGWNDLMNWKRGET